FTIFLFNEFIIEYSLLIFFFFQAEDGIRDATVTGVQTCALPISAAQRGPPARATYLGAGGPRCAAVARAYEEDRRLGLDVLSVRSEERRVGKECRSGRTAKM